MTLALSMWSVHRTVKQYNWTVIDFLSYCHNEGIEQVELLDIFWKDVHAELPEVVDFLQANLIQVIGYAVTNNFVHEDPKLRQMAFHKITDAIPIAIALGAPVIRVYAGNQNGSVDFEVANEWIFDGLCAAAAEAGQHGLTLCLENHGLLAGQAVQIQSIIEQVNSPFLNATFDTGNFILVDERPIQALQELMPYVRHIHLKDVAFTEGGRYVSVSGRTYEGCVLGEGIVNMEDILQFLIEHQYDGAIVLEYDGREDERTVIKKCIHAYLQMMEKARLIR